MAIGDDVETRRIRQAESDGCGSGVDFDVVLRRSGEANFHIASAIVDFDFAAGVLQRDIVLRAHAEVPRGVKYFEVARAGLHVAGELREGEIRAPRNEADALRDFVCADGPVKFAVDRKNARGARDINIPAVAGYLDVAVGVGNFDVAFSRVDSDISRRAANLHIANAICHVDGLRHVRDGDAAFLIANRQRSLLRNRHVKIQADARVARADPRGTDFVAVAILHDFDANSIGNLLGIALVPRLGILLARDSNLRLIRRPHADVAVAILYRDATIRRNGFGRDLQVKIKRISPFPNMSGYLPLADTDSHDDARQRQQSQNQKNFARRDTCCT